MYSKVKLLKIPWFVSLDFVVWVSVTVEIVVVWASVIIVDCVITCCVVTAAVVVSTTGTKPADNCDLIVDNKGYFP